MTDIGHNSDVPAGFAKEQLRSFVERVERLEEEIKGLNSDKRDVFAEAKANGFDVKALKTILAIRRQDPDDRKEHDTVVELYAQALGIHL